MTVSSHILKCRPAERVCYGRLSSVINCCSMDCGSLKGSGVSGCSVVFADRAFFVTFLGDGLQAFHTRMVLSGDTDTY